MAQPNQLNPEFQGRVKATAFEATHKNGVCSTTLKLYGTTATYLCSDSANYFRGKITGILLSTYEAVGQTVTVKGTGGATIATLTGGSATGNVSGVNAPITNALIELDGTISAVSNWAADRSYVTLWYRVYDENDES